MDTGDIAAGLLVLVVIALAIYGRPRTQQGRTEDEERPPLWW